jgi:hypothetical protein
MGAHRYVCVDVLPDDRTKNASLHTSQRALTIMHVLMSCKSGLLIECFNTHFTDIGMLITMYAFISYKMALKTKCFITHFTGIRALTTTYVFVLSDGSKGECFIIHFTNIMVLTTMYAFMLSDGSGE